jgi:hypothetical protein
MINTILSRREFGAAAVTATIAWYSAESSCHESDFQAHHALCETSPTSAPTTPIYTAPSWLRRNLLSPIGVSLPVPRVLNPSDPALKLPRRHVQRRVRDEQAIRALLEQGPNLRGQPDKIKVLHEKICEVSFGKGVTAQVREDFLVQYGCTGWNVEVLETIVEACETRGIVELGAGHGQWARALTEAYQKSKDGRVNPRKKFDFVLAFDDMSNLPLNTHIYNPYTKPHHDNFGNVQKLEIEDTARILQSWACRGRVLLLVYPPTGDMAMNIVSEYVDAAPENDTVIFVGEGRGGANGDDALFDFFECGDWVLLQVMDVQKPPGDKGYEKLYILQRRDVSCGRTMGSPLVGGSDFSPCLCFMYCTQL